MNAEVHRKLVVRAASALFALLLVYIALSGPVLRWSYNVATRNGSATTTGPFDAVAPDQLVSIYVPPDADYARRLKALDAIQTFYAPLIRAAATVRLKASLDAYLGVWNVNAVEFDNGTVAFLILPKLPNAPAWDHGE